MDNNTKSQSNGTKKHPTLDVVCSRCFGQLKSQFKRVIDKPNAT